LANAVARKARNIRVHTLVILQNDVREGSDKLFSRLRNPVKIVFYDFGWRKSANRLSGTYKCPIVGGVPAGQTNDP
jgi:hypothetical protein